MTRDSPQSNVKPCSCSVLIKPPHLPSFSIISNWAPCRFNKYPTVNPVKPPPRIAVVMSSSYRVGAFCSRLSCNQLLVSLFCRCASKAVFSSGYRNDKNVLNSLLIVSCLFAICNVIACIARTQSRASLGRAMLFRVNRIA